MPTTITLLSNAVTGATSLSQGLSAFNGPITIVVTGQSYARFYLLVSLLGYADWAADGSPASITIRKPGTYTLNAVNANGIHAFLDIYDEMPPVTVTASY